MSRGSKKPQSSERTVRSLLAAIVTTVAAAAPGTVSVPDGYRRACRSLSLSPSAAAILTAGYGAAGCAVALSPLTVAVGGPLATVVSLALLAGGLGVAALARYGVPFAAETKRVRTLGAAPSLVSALVLGATLWPSAERAAAFATRASDAPLAARLDSHRRRAAGTPRSGLDAFAAAWGEAFPALERAVGLVERATAASASERPAILDSARRQILDGTRDEMAAFAASLRGPATGLYAFGVLLPLAMVSLLPAAAAAGIPITGSVVAGLYGVLLPAALLVACAWLLGRRPVAFPPVPVPRSHPNLPDTALLTVIAGVAGAVAGGGLANSLVASWAMPVGALGTGTGAALVVHYRPAKHVRDRVDAVEAGLSDLLSSVGRRLDGGQSVESALNEAAAEASSPTEDIIDAAVARQSQLGTSVEGAFLGPGGALAALPSRRTRRAATLLGTASAVGPPAGEALMAMGDHLDELQAVERETRRDLARITETLSNTAALFGPLVGGATVALSGSMGGGSGQFNAVPSATLGLVVGWYVLVLAVLLTALSTGLHRGLDRALVGYRAGLALLSATATFLTAVVATGLLI